MLILTGFGFFGLSTYDYLFKKVSLSANTKTSVILSGKVDSCCSEFGIVRELNNKLNPILLRLVVPIPLNKGNKFLQTLQG